ncbi:MAG: nicotinamide riboside transporter PnuC, partial [Bacteroidota bacterium]
KKQVKKPMLKVSRLSGYDFVCIFLSSILLSFGVGYLYSVYTTGKLPYLDAFHAVLILVTYVLLARKKVEAWLFSICANLIYVFVCLQTTLGELFLKYMLYIILSCYGYYKWRNEYLTIENQSEIAPK